MAKLKWGALALVLIAFFSRFSHKKDTPVTKKTAPTEKTKTITPPIVKALDPNACNIKQQVVSKQQGLKIYSWKGDKFVINNEDANGVAQMYIGNIGNSTLTCITCQQQAGGPKVDRMKMQPSWHPSGKWLFMAVERDVYTTPPILGSNKDYVEGELQSGIWVDMWAVTLDGKQWTRLTDFKSNVPGVADGYTGPAFTPDGKKAVWSQIMSGNILTYWPFGKWELTQADFVDNNGIPELRNRKNITPSGMNWNEPGNFSPDNESLVLSGSTEKDAQGMDQYILNIRTGKLTNLNNTPTVWDEHGLFSPDGEKVVFMSAYPYRDDPNSSKVLTIKTEFMLMNKDGSALTQLTHYRTPGFPESQNAIAAVAVWSLDGRSLSARTLAFPNYIDWDINFQGNCGNRLI